MAHIGFLCPPIPGHVNPVSTLARAVADRGHRTTAFQIPDARGVFEAQQLNFVPLGERSADIGALGAAVARLGSLSGLRAMKFTIQCGAALADAVCRYAPAAIERARVDLLVIDQNDPAGAAVAEHLGIPFINVLAALPLNREPKVPPPFAGWSYTGGMATTVLNTVAYAAFDRWLSPINKAVNQHRASWSLRPIRLPDDTFSSLAQLSQLPEEFDFPRESKPAVLHYLGPFTDDRRPVVSFPYERLNGRPLVYASFGTLMQSGRTVHRAFASACKDLDLQLVISAGGKEFDDSELPGKPIIVRYAPQLQVLQLARLCISHGGLNTVLESLSCGVPLVVVPATNDNPAIGARVRRAGVGEVISSKHLTATRLREALERILTSPTVSSKAREMQASIKQAGGVQRAADIVERVIARARTAAS